MKFNNKDIDLIEAYLDGSLDSQEIKTVEDRISIDPDFKELLTDMRHLIKGIKAEGRKSLRQDLKELDQSLPDIHSLVKERKYKSRTIWRYWNYAAAAVLLLGLFLWSKPGIPGEFLKPYSSGDTFRSANISKANAYHSEPGFSSYFAEDYKAAVNEFESIQAKNDTVWFYLGNTYFAQRKYKKALNCFEDKSLAANTVFVDDAKWYAALCLVSGRQYDKASTYLEYLAEENTIYSSKAEKLLEKRRFK